MSKEDKPIVFKHTKDGKWRSRFNGRTFKFEEGKHEPGVDGGPPPTVPSGAFKVIPLELRTREIDLRRKAEIAEEKQAAQAQAEPSKEPQVAPEPEAKPEPEPEPTPPPAPEPVAQEPETFPAYCADAIGRIPATEAIPEEAGGHLGDEEQPNLLPLPEDESADQSDDTLPLIEMLVDSMFQMGEQLGGPAAPKSATMGALTTEGLRDMMVRSAKEAFPSADVEMGPKTTLGLCFFGYLGLCYSRERFRQNTDPWLKVAGRWFGDRWAVLKSRVGGAWSRWRQPKQPQASERKPDKKEESRDA